MQVLRQNTSKPISLTPQPSISSVSPISPYILQNKHNQPSAISEYRNLYTNTNFDLETSHLSLGSFQNNFTRDENKTHENLLIGKRKT